MEARRILICDDDLISREIFKITFRREPDIIIDFATDGLEAKNLLVTHTYELVITDMNMPHISGVELTHWIRNDLKLKIPIIVISGYGKDELTKKLSELGVSEILSKPFNMAMIRKSVFEKLEEYA